MKRQFSGIKIPTVWSSKGENGKRGQRILPERQQGYFVHVTSRAVQQRFLFRDAEKTQFIQLLQAWAAFSDITVLTYCILNNHFHLLLWVPPKKQTLSYEEAVERIGYVWPENKIERWKMSYRAAGSRTQREMLQSLANRMRDLPEFMRVFKQSFSCWYNLNHQVGGTLWEGRYRSMVVKDNPESLLRVATYIDLNPVRAKVCKHPDEYAWSGFGQASRDRKVAQKGLVSLMKFTGGRLPQEMKVPGQALQSSAAIRDESVCDFYKAWLYLHGQAKAHQINASPKQRKRSGFTSFEVLAVFAKTKEEILMAQTHNPESSNSSQNPS